MEIAGQWVVIGDKTSAVWEIFKQEWWVRIETARSKLPAQMKNAGVSGLPLCQLEAVFRWSGLSP